MGTKNIDITNKIASNEYRGEEKKRERGGLEHCVIQVNCFCLLKIVDYDMCELMVFQHKCICLVKRKQINMHA